MTLPTEKTKPKTSITELVTLIYGPPKIGKSTFCAQADSPLFLATEAGLNHLEVFQLPIQTWSEFCEACREIAAGEHSYKTVAIDTIDNLYRFCSKHVLAKHGLQHESDAEYGKGWALVNGEFQAKLTALSLLPYGLMMTSHSQEKEVKTPTGKENRVAPTLPNSARKIVLGMADLVLYAEMGEIRDNDGRITGYERILHSQPTTIYEAGNRMNWPVPDPLPLSYQAFAQAARTGFGTTIEDPTTKQTAKLSGGNKDK